MIAIGNLWLVAYPTENCPEGVCSESAVVVPTMCFGIGQGFFNGSTFNALLYFIQGNNVGSICGISSGLQNAGLFITYTVLGFFKDNHSKDGGFYWVTRFSFVLALIGCVFAFTVYIMDLREQQIL